MFPTVIDTAGYLLPHYGAHAAPDKTEVHGGYQKFLPIAFTHRYPNSFMQTGRLHCIFNSVLVRLKVGKVQKIFRDQFIEQFLVIVVAINDLEIIFRVYLFVIAAFGTHMQVVLQFGNQHGCLTVRALMPNTFRSLLLLFSRSLNTLPEPFPPWNFFLHTPTL